jgi:hypothetical protein
MEISLGSLLVHLVCALANVVLGIVKKGVRALFSQHYFANMAWSPVLGIAGPCRGRLPPAGLGAFQHFCARAGTSGGALAIGRSMLALNTLAGIMQNTSNAPKPGSFRIKNRAS